MRKIALGILAVCGLWSCNQHSTTGWSQEQPVAVTIPVHLSEQEVILRATDENSIADVNVYLVQDRSVLLHKYFTSTTVQFEYPAGRYRLYVIANHHADLGDLDFERLRAYTLHHAERYDDLPMTAVADIDIAATGDMQILPPIEVERAVAKVNYNVKVAASCADILLQSVQVMSIPASFRPFDTNAPTDEYRLGEIIENEAHICAMSGSFYMLPNLQGTVQGITSQQQKNPQTAPANASCIRIRAIRNNEVLDYSVYLGENETSDFNVRSNTAHTLDITILNAEETDVRMHKYTVDIVCQVSEEPQNGVYMDFSPIMLTTTLQGQTEDTGLYCELKINDGERRSFRVDGNGIQGSATPLELQTVQGVNRYKLEYSPYILTNDNAVLSFTVDIYDKHGFVLSKDFTYRYASKIVQVYTKWFNGGQDLGVIWSPDAVKCIRKTTISSVYYLFYCADECTIVAEPREGYSGYSLYCNHDLTGFLTSERTYRYFPVSSYDTLYAYFN